MQCPHCATPNPAQARFCMGCGAQLVQGVICERCYTLLPPQARYCTHCGAYVPQPLGPDAISPSPTAQRGVHTPAATGPTPATPQSAPAVQSYEPPPAAASLSPLSAARPLAELLPALRRFLPADLYEPLSACPRRKT